MFDFKNLINALLRKKDDGSVSDLKSATVMMQELPQSDVHEAQSEIVKTLIGLNKNEKMSPRERAKTVMYLDEKAQLFQQKLGEEYLANIEIAPSHVKHYLPTMHAFWTEIGTAYKLCIKGYVSKPSKSLGDLMPLITARTLHAYAMIAKWNHLRYLPIDGRLWRNLHRFYVFAETEGFASTPVRLYPGDKQDTNCTSEYVQPLLLMLANPESLRVEQIQLIDSWLDEWAKTIVVEEQIRPHRQVFAVNLEDPKPARKIRRNMVGPKYRYWSTEALVEHIKGLQQSLKEGEVPAKLGLTEAFRLPHGLDLLETVVNRWSREGAAASRKHERQSTKKSVQVVHGFYETMLMLKHPGKTAQPLPSEQGAKVDYQVQGPNTVGRNTTSPDLFEPTLDEWMVQDESVAGVGASFYSSQPEGFKIGTLVGLKTEGKQRFGIGAIRRISRGRDGQVFVGIETLCQTPILVQILLVRDGGQVVDCLYIPDQSSDGVARSLILPPESFALDRVAELRAQGKAYTIRLKQPLVQANDYVRVQFDVLAKH